MIDAHQASVPGGILIANVGTQKKKAQVAQELIGSNAVRAQGGVPSCPPRLLVAGTHASSVCAPLPAPLGVTASVSSSSRSSSSSSGAGCVGALCLVDGRCRAFCADPC